MAFAFVPPAYFPSSAETGKCVFARVQKPRLPSTCGPSGGAAGSAHPAKHSELAAQGEEKNSNAASQTKGTDHGHSPPSLKTLRGKVGTSLEVQQLIGLPVQGVSVQSLVRELRSHMPHGQEHKT